MELREYIDRVPRLYCSYAKENEKLKEELAAYEGRLDKKEGPKERL